MEELEQIRYETLLILLGMRVAVCVCIQTAPIFVRDVYQNTDILMCGIYQRFALMYSGKKQNKTKGV